MSDSVSVIDSSTNTVVKTINVGDQPYAITVDPITNNIYTVNFNTKDVSVIDGSTNTVTDSIDVGEGPLAVEFNPSNGNIYVATPMMTLYRLLTVHRTR